MGKRPPVLAEEEEEVDEELQEEGWPVRGIISENTKKKLYKIQWEGTDPATGELWEPTWEPYDSVDSSVVQEWEATKQAKDYDVRANKTRLKNMDIARNARDRSRSRSTGSDFDGSASIDMPSSSSKATPASIVSYEELPMVVSATLKKRKRPSSVVYPEVESGSSYNPTSQSQTVSSHSTTNTSSTVSTEIEPREIRELFGYDYGIPEPPALTAEQQAKKKRRVSFGNVTRKGRTAASADEEEAIISRGEEEDEEDASESENMDSRGTSFGSMSQDLDDSLTAGKRKGKLVTYTQKKDSERQAIRDANRAKNMQRRERQAAEAAEVIRKKHRTTVTVSGDDSASDDHNRPREAATRRGEKAEPMRVASSISSKPSDPAKASKKTRPVLKELPESLRLPPTTMNTATRPTPVASTSRPSPPTSAASNALKQAKSKALRQSVSGMPTASVSISPPPPPFSAAQRSADDLARKIIASASPERRTRPAVYESTAVALPPAVNSKGKQVAKGNEKTDKRVEVRASERDPSVHDKAAGTLPRFKRVSSSEQSSWKEPSDSYGTIFESESHHGKGGDTWPADLLPLLEQEEPQQTGTSAAVTDDMFDEPDTELPPPLSLRSHHSDTSTHFVPDSQPISAQPSAAFIPTSIAKPPIKIARTLKKIHPPEPEVFKPYLRPEYTYDDVSARLDSDPIRQFSSQVSAVPERDILESTYPQQLARSSHHVQRSRFPSIESRAERMLREKQQQEVEEEVIDDGVDDVGSSHPLARFDGSRTEDAMLVDGNNLDFLAQPVSGEANASTNLPSQPSVDNPQKACDTGAPAEGSPGASNPVSQATHIPNVMPAVPQVLETSTSEKLAASKLRSSTLLTDEEIKAEISMFLEMPGYYGNLGRPLTAKPKWELELEKDEGTGASWWIVVLPSVAEWRLEKRLVPKPSANLAGTGVLVNGSDGAYTRLLARFEELQSSHESLQRTHDAGLMRCRALEGDLARMAQQYQDSANKLAQWGLDIANLKAENKRLRESLDKGVKQVQLVGDAKAERLTKELDRARKELEMAHHLARQSNDHQTREKAARTEELEARERQRQTNMHYLPPFGAAAYDGVAMHDAGIAPQATLGDGFQLMEDDESEDGDFQAGTSSASESSSESTSSDDHDAISQSVASRIISNTASQLPMDPGALKEHTARLHALSDDPQDISMAMDDASAQLAQTHSSLLHHTSFQADELAMAPKALLATNIAVIEEPMDTSGETTVATVTNTSSNQPTSQSQSQSQTASSGQDVEDVVAKDSSSMNVDIILALDSESLGSERVYRCQLAPHGIPCGETAQSHKALFSHLEEAHFAIAQEEV